MKLIIIVGIPGSGKTTLAKSLSKIYYEADSYPGLYKDGILQPHYIKQAHIVCQNDVKYAMKNKIDVIVQSNTNIDKKAIIPYIYLASTYGYTIQIIIPSFGLLHYSGIDKQLEHLINIRSKGDKIIPRYSIERMAKLYEENKEKLVKLSYLSNPDEMLDLV